MLSRRIHHFVSRTRQVFNSIKIIGCIVRRCQILKSLDLGRNVNGLATSTKSGERNLPFIMSQISIS